MSSQSARLNSPPRACVAFRVGIVGHRPNRLPKNGAALDTLRQMLRCVLEEVKSAVLKFARSEEAKLVYSGARPILRAVSPLAEGSDRMFAEEAVGLGYDLLCPMPFSQEEFEKDFMPPGALEEDSRDRFRGLLKRARENTGLTTFELDGERSAAADAYGAAGRVVLNQSDLLIVVWDGEKPAGGGGTVQTLHEAVQYRLPVLWIDTRPPHAWQLLHSRDDLICLDRDGRCTPSSTPPTSSAEVRNLIAATVKTIVDDELGLPKQPADGGRASTTVTHAVEYFRERKPWFNFAFVWKLFRDAVGQGRIRFQSIVVGDFEDQISADWPVRRNVKATSTSSRTIKVHEKDDYTPSGVEDWVNRHLRPHYAWPDKRGDLYADAYRSAYVLTYLLSASAVFMALLPFAASLQGIGQTVCVAIEFVTLLIIVLLLVAGRWRRWHERWMEYRLLAELIRQIRFLIPLGGGRPLPRAPAHLGGYENPIQTWMYWQTRAIARATGIPQAKVTPEYVLDCLRYLAKVVGGTDSGQLKFHSDTEKRSKLIGHRLHLTSTMLFVLTIFSIVIHLTLGLSDSAPLPSWLHIEFLQTYHAVIDRWLVLLAATLPAFGAALAGIANQGEFARLAKRSAAMANGFEQFVAQIEALQSRRSKSGEALKLSSVIPIAGDIAGVMVDEVADWRVVFIDRPPAAP